MASIAERAKWVDAAAALVCGVAALQFVFAGIQKLDDPTAFAQAVGRHGLVGSSIGDVVWAIAIGELAIGVLLVAGLLFPKLIIAALGITGAVLGGFTAYLCVVWFERGPVLDCGCKGIMALSIAGATLRNAVFLIAMTWLFVRRMQRCPAAPTAGGADSFRDWLPKRSRGT